MGAEVETVEFNKQITPKLSVDLQIFIEHVFMEDFNRVFPAKHSYLFVNQEHLTDWDLAAMRDKTVTTLCKTNAGLRTLLDLRVDGKFVGFGNPIASPAVFSCTKKLPGCVVHIAGSSTQKGTTMLIEAWRTHIEHAQLSIQPMLVITAFDFLGGSKVLFDYWRTLRPSRADLPSLLMKLWPVHLPVPSFECTGSIYLCRQSLSPEVIQFIQAVGTIHACPSIIEGWGHSIDEARRSRSVAVVLDAPPMNELVDHTCGIVVAASAGPPVQEIFPKRWTQYLPKNYFPPTFKTTCAALGDGLKQALEMREEGRMLLGDEAVRRSRLDAERFTSAVSQLFLMHLMMV